MSEDSLSVLLLSGTDTLVIRKKKDSNFFLTTQDSLIISRKGFTTLLNFLVKSGLIHTSTLQGILEEFSTF